MENIIRKVLANYFDTTKETQTQHLTPNFNSHTMNDFIDFDQEQLKSILPVVRVKDYDVQNIAKNTNDVIQSLDVF